jgi:hypothetical protein
MSKLTEILTDMNSDDSYADSVCETLAGYEPHDVARIVVALEDEINWLEEQCDTLRDLLEAAGVKTAVVYREIKQVGK